jgi:putative holliday junction resolvase
MPIVSLEEIAADLPARGALVGLDLGTKTIGVAASDPDRRLATPVTTVLRQRFGADAERVLALAAERRAVGFVLGLPINMDGSEGPRAQSTRAFARNFAKLTALPIALWDERLSTAAVERALIAADASRARRKAVIDQHAAAYILQGALDRLARAQPDSVRRAERAQLSPAHQGRAVTFPAERAPEGVLLPSPQARRRHRGRRPAAQAACARTPRSPRPARRH